MFNTEHGHLLDERFFDTFHYEKYHFIVHWKEKFEDVGTAMMSVYFCGSSASRLGNFHLRKLNSSAKYEMLFIDNRFDINITQVAHTT